MPLFAGLYAGLAPAAEVERTWELLTGGLGAPISEARDGPFRAGVYGRHAGERATVPSALHRAPDEVSVGYGGDPTGRGAALLVPPWLLCRYQPASRTMSIEADRHGFGLVYTRSIGEMTAVCSSAARLGRIPPSLDRDPSALAELLAFDHLLGERTLRRGVRALPQGHRLEVGPDGTTERRVFAYGDLPVDSAPPRAAWADVLVPAWREAVRAALDQAPDGAPVSIPLSGGLDSRMLAAATTELGRAATAFTFSAGDDAPDVVIAREVASRLRMPWKRLELTEDWLATHGTEAARLTDGQLDVVHSYGISVVDGLPTGHLRLDGLAGDVVLGGSFLDGKLLGAVTRDERIRAIWRARSRLDSPAWQALLLPEARETMRAAARASLADSIDTDGVRAGDPRWSDFWILRHRIRRFARQGALLWEAGCDSVFPFFEPRWIDLLLSVPPRLRAGAALQAAVYHRGWPLLAEVPWQKTGLPIPRPGLGGRIARAIERRPALSPGALFYDFDRALSTSARLRTWIDALLLERPGIDTFGCFDRAAVERLVRDGAAGTEKAMGRLGLLCTLVLSERVWSQDG